MKSVFLSQTIQGTIINVLVIVVQVFDLKIANEEVTQVISGLFGLIGTVLTIYGRIKANQPLGIFGKEL